MRLLILSAAGFCTAVDEVHKGSSGSISLDGYSHDDRHTWRIKSDCKTVHFKSGQFGNIGDNIFHIIEDYSPIVIIGENDERFNHTTNTGNVAVHFSWPEHEDADFFVVDWECAESYESDACPCTQTATTHWKKGEECRRWNGDDQHDIFGSNVFKQPHVVWPIDMDNNFCYEMYQGSDLTWCFGINSWEPASCPARCECSKPTTLEADDADETESNVETLSPWESWSESCSVTCGTGQQYRSRHDLSESEFRDCDKEQCVPEHEGLSGSISLDGYSHDEYHTWRINSDCESLHFKSEKFGNINLATYSYIYEEGSAMVIIGKNDEQFNHTTNTGNVVVNLFWPEHEDADFFVVDWECAESNESDVINSCDADPCDVHENCKDVLGEYTCSCMDGYNWNVDFTCEAAVVDEVDEVEKDDESNVRSDEELALTKAVCPSSDCWTLNEANSTCEIILSSDCFQLDCSFDRMTIKFDYGLFGGSSEAPQLNDFSPAISQFDVAENLPFMLDCEFDQCAISPEVVLAPRKLNLKTTITKSKNGNDMVKLGDDVLIRNANGVSMVFLCVYETEIKLTDAKFNVKKAEVAGSVSERGDLDLGFTLEVMGSEYIGGTRSALITWKQGGKLSNINFLATDCTIEHGGKKISIIKETCISRGLNGQSGSQTDHKKIIEFNWMSFMLLEKETVTQQTLVCKILICTAGADDCTPISDDACPGNDDGYDFQQFKIY